MKNKKVGKLQSSLIGYLIALTLIGSMAFVAIQFGVQLENNYNVGANISLSKYDSYDNLVNISKDAEADAKADTDKNAVDIIGGLFTKGYRMVRTLTGSMGLFNDMVEDASLENPALQKILDFLALMVAILLVGVIASSLLRRDI